MSSKNTVHISFITQIDARHKQGASFAPSMRALIADGYPVEIATGGDVITFTDANEFAKWFLVDRLKKLHSEMEAHGDKGEDWALARHLEDVIGAGQASGHQIVKAENLLVRFGH